MISKPKEFYGGLGMLVAFAVILVIIFIPLFDGRNGLQYLDDLYNTISKGSAYYIPAVKEEVGETMDMPVSFRLEMNSEQQADRTARLFAAAGPQARAEGAHVEVAGNLGEVLESVVSDADDMYFNKGGAISGKYGYPAREVLFNWWTALRLMDKELKHQKQFKGAKTVALVQNKAVEPAYNYYGIEAQRITDRLGIVIFSLVFYVAYTLWYGFAILFLFEGWGMRLGH